MNSVGIVEFLDQLVSGEWARAGLVLALVSTCVVIVVFAYLSRHTKKSHFNLWAVAWMFHAVWLAASTQWKESPEQPLLIMASRAWIGVSAMFMLWGSLELANKARRRRELNYGVVLILMWSYVAAFVVRDSLWITVPVFVLLAGA